MNKLKHSILIILGILFLVIGTVPAFAQTMPITTPYVSTPIAMGPGPVVLCSAIGTTLSYGQHDAIMPKNVTILQNFLYSKGYLGVQATGYFGSLTLQAVKTFQQQYDLTIDGIVGPLTRARISAVACPSTTPVSAPTISSITPTAGPSQTNVTITGTGFTDNNIVHLSVGAISGLGSINNGTSITFTLPSSIGPYCKPGQACPMYMALLTNGTYPVSVETANGSSNSVSFTVTGSQTLQPN
jgi:hypothetical protein